MPWLKLWVCGAAVTNSVSPFYAPSSWTVSILIITGSRTLGRVGSTVTTQARGKFAHLCATPAKPKMASGLSEYELQRLENIRRNQRVLESLGLVSRDAELHQDLRKSEPRAKKQKAPPATEGSAEDARAAVRRSHRLAGLPADGADGADGAGGAGGAGCADGAGGAASPWSVTGEHERARDDYEAAWAGRWSGRQASTTPVGTCADTSARTGGTRELAPGPQRIIVRTLTSLGRAVCPVYVPCTVAPQVGTASYEHTLMRVHLRKTSPTRPASINAPQACGWAEADRGSGQPGARPEL